MLAIGTKAPDFTLMDQNGETHSLHEYAGKKVILYFYPKDNTPGCTKEACSFGDLYPQITEKGAIVLGISKDSVKSHKNFAEKYLIRIMPSLKPMMSGRKRRTTAVHIWALCAAPISLMKTA